MEIEAGSEETTGSTRLKGTEEPIRIWKPLSFRRNEFRILKLLGATSHNGKQIINAALNNFPINNHPPYDALSYCWGQSQGSQEIMLNGIPHLITENLREALVTLMDQGITSLWVDALSIDQDDTDEKASRKFPSLGPDVANDFQPQELVLGIKRTEAESVIIWLGSASTTSDQLLRQMKDAYPIQQVRRFWTDVLIEVNDNFVLYFKPEFLDFLKRSYWFRLWVVQEIAVAQKIRLFCGSESISGLILESLFSKDLWERLRFEAGLTWNISPPPSFVHMVNIWKVRHFVRTRKPMDLLTMLYELRESFTTLAVDRVYSLLGLVFDQRAFITEPDYTLPAAELCILMSRRFIKATGSLDLAFLTQRSNTIPSWCCPFTTFHLYQDPPPRNSKLPNRHPALLEYINAKSRILRCGELATLWKATDCSVLADDNADWGRIKLRVYGLRLGKYSDVNASHRPVLLSLNTFDAIGRLLTMYSPIYTDENQRRRFFIHLLECGLISAALSQMPQQHECTFRHESSAWTLDFDLYRILAGNTWISDAGYTARKALKMLKSAREMFLPDTRDGEGGRELLRDDAHEASLQPKGESIVQGILHSGTEEAIPEVRAPGGRSEHAIIDALLKFEDWRKRTEALRRLNLSMRRSINDPLTDHDPGNDTLTNDHHERQLEEMLDVAKQKVETEAAGLFSTEEVRDAVEAVSTLVNAYGHFYMINGKYVGLAPVDVGVLRVPVEVWLLSGFSMPVLLAKVDSHNDEPVFRIWSEAFVDTVDVHGKCCNVMTGEAWRSYRPEDFEWVTIV
ncbi:hypothetical protein H2200_002622 [Cladophialophora chaetospira]|uniref:Heterokaryon incompatibility domain-containing protein n=1 Tax=Cladophialophora chaetospira TaxID=386627 RepID=A0AA38XJ74_9EURO|nr:hypothetical protein H2200_002622 [Cladophialophora chaetospira]